MNRLGISIIAAALTVSPGGANARRAPETSPAVSISGLPDGRFELIYSGTRFTSRDEAERQLLVSAARLALAHGELRFVLLALPGERTDVHPLRPNPTFGAKYGHWQPHWNYYVPQFGWQWWHPEWGAEFWSVDVDPRTVEHFEAHAMIDLGQRASVLDENLQFKASDVVRDLGGPPGVIRVRERH